MINCYTFVVDHKEARNLVKHLNSIKSSSSENFYIDYDYNKNNGPNNHLIKGRVTEQDWESLNLNNILSIGN